MSSVRALEPLEPRIREVADLPTLPTVVARALELVDHSGATLREVGDLLATDQVLSARTLRLVNAPFFGLRRPLRSVAEAAIYLGRSGVRNLVVSSALVDSFAMPGGERPSARFWEHAFASGVYARHFAAHACPPLAEDAYLAGLLHDLGRLVLRCHFGTEERQVQAEARASGRPLIVVEQEVWRASHADAAYWLGQHWHLPEPLLEGVRFHHRPEEAPAGSQAFCAVVHLADEVAFEQGFSAQDEFDGVHGKLERGTALLASRGRFAPTPEELRALVAEETADVRPLVEMVFRS